MDKGQQHYNIIFFSKRVYVIKSKYNTKPMDHEVYQNIGHIHLHLFEGQNELMSHTDSLAAIIRNFKHLTVFQDLLQQACEYDLEMPQLQSSRPTPNRIGGKQKRPQQSTSADHKLLEAVFLIAICRQTGDKWQSKTLFLFLIYVG